MSALRTQAQADTLAREAGFTPANAEIAAAIAMAETFTLRDGKPYCDFAAVGDLHLVNDTYGPSYGAWQIRSILGNSGTGSHRDPLRLDNFDPAFNAEAALSVFKMQGWRAWSTFNAQAHLAFLDKAVHNPVPALPAGAYRVKPGDSLSAIGTRLGYRWQDIATVNHIEGPRYILNLGVVLLLPDFPYVVRTGDTLSKIAATVGSDLTWFRLWQYNLATVPNPDRISVGQTLKIPRLIPA